MKKDLKEYVPKHRLDNYYMEELYNLSEDEIEEIVYDLIFWLKDMSQPISKEIAPLLVEKPNAIKKQVIEILNNELEDSILKYNIISYVLLNLNKENLKDYEESLKRIVEKPTKYEKYYETTLIAKELLNKIN